jgi:plasmid maintenance system antidote protein VapI
MVKRISRPMSGEELRDALAQADISQNRLAIALRRTTRTINRQVVGASPVTPELECIARWLADGAITLDDIETALKRR